MQRNNRLKWPSWQQPGENEVLQLVKMTTKYIRFLHPQIVEAVANDNYRQREAWCYELEARGIDPELYLWEGSPCAFPGVRRYTGTGEHGRLRDKNDDYSDIGDVIAIDDNNYPKHIWSFVLRDTQFSTPGPEGYRLAHLIDHKDYKNRMRDELVSDSLDLSIALPGLYTCPSNTVFICSGLLLPTDFNAALRSLMQRRALHLYENCCNILPEGIHIPPETNKAWSVDSFEWADCVGDSTYIEDFLDFRKKKIQELLNNTKRNLQIQPQ